MTRRHAARSQFVRKARTRHRQAAHVLADFLARLGRVYWARPIAGAFRSRDQPASSPRPVCRRSAQGHLISSGRGAPTQAPVVQRGREGGSIWGGGGGPPAPARPEAPLRRQPPSPPCSGRACCGTAQARPPWQQCALAPRHPAQRVGVGGGAVQQVHARHGRAGRPAVPGRNMQGWPRRRGARGARRPKPPRRAEARGPILREAGPRIGASGHLATNR